jgi:hypothetical protein
MTDPSSAIGEPQRRQANLMPFGAGAALLLILFAIGNAVGGELGQIMAASLNALPFAVLAVLAYLGAGRPNWAWVATALWLLLMIGGLSLIAVGFGISALADGPLTAGQPAELTGDDWAACSCCRPCAGPSRGRSRSTQTPSSTLWPWWRSSP